MRRRRGVGVDGQAVCHHAASVLEIFHQEWAHGPAHGHIVGLALYEARREVGRVEVEHAVVVCLGLSERRLHHQGRVAFELVGFVAGVYVHHPHRGVAGEGGVLHAPLCPKAQGHEAEHHKEQQGEAAGGHRMSISLCVWSERRHCGWRSIYATVSAVFCPEQGWRKRRGQSKRAAVSSGSWPGILS